MEDLLAGLYFNPKHPASFGSAQKLWNYARHIDPTIKFKDVVEWLSSQTTYTLHRPARKNFLRNKIYVSYIDEQWEIDLVDLRQLSRENNGYNYILNVIDSFSKYLFSVPLKTKTALEVINAFKKIFKVRKPYKIRSDKGGEFDNRQFRDFCERNNIIYFTTQNSTIKCAIVERVNRTLKNKIFRYFTKYGTRKYVDVLQDIVDSYNNSIHRSTRMAPTDINEDDEQEVFENLYGAPNLLSILPKRNKKKYKLKIGDNVRQKYDIGPLEKSYYPMWTDMVYKVHQIYNKLIKPQYTIEIDGDILKRRYYPEELQKVKIDPNTLWLIEKKLKYRYRNGQKQVLVKWKGYPAKFNQWIPADQIQNLS